MNTAAALTLLTELLRQAAAISSLVRAAQTEGRELTSEELDACAANDDAARQLLVDAIARAKGK